ncbi:unnamed protein product [Hyaloperonospora brassicae]|uniref:Elicitin-like protein n=1 Tax=Hyaloperonospora brassicae TaxID=162125 RepID=A0AAV0UCS1_HYABA|nr:unnamed protein product [Hyaloperonospora brassicae]
MTVTAPLPLLLFALVVARHLSAGQDVVAVVTPSPPVALVDTSGPNATREAAVPLAVDLLLPPIHTASPASSTFQVVADVVCNATETQKLYALYGRNRALFDLCVTDARYHVFPFLGTKPSAEQVANMASSMSCVALFSGALLATFPECTISGFPLKAAMETVLKVHVDLVHGWAPPPTAERFLEIITWRKCVNLAREVGAPSDADSELYGQFETNLALLCTDSPVRLLPDYRLEYQLGSGSWHGAEEIKSAQVGDTRQGSRDGVVATVSPGDSDLNVGDREATDVTRESTIAESGCAPKSRVSSSGLASALVSALLGVYLVGIS